MAIVTISFRYSLSDEELAAENGLDLAHRVAGMPGLLWKIWLHDPKRRAGQGVYRFESEEAARAYLDGPILTHLRQTEGYHDIEAHIWDVLAEQSAITRAPGLEELVRS